MQIKKILGYYWSHLRVYKWIYFASLGAFAISAILLNIIVPIVYKHIFDLIASGDAAILIKDELMGALFLAILLIIISNIMSLIGEYMYPASQSKVMKSLLDYAYARVQNHSSSFFADNFTGGLVAKIKRLHESYERIQDIVSFQIWMNGIILTSTFVALLWFAPILALIFIVWLAFFIIGTVLFIKPMSDRDTLHSEEKSNTTAVLADSITNVGTIKMFANSLVEYSVFAQQTDKEEKARYKAWLMHNHLRAFQMIATALAEIASMYIAIHLWIDGSISIGTIMLMQIYLFKVFVMVWNMGRQMSAMVNAFADAKEIIDIFETPIDVQDIAKPEKCKIKAGKIEVKDINFSYHSGEEEGESIFKDFSLVAASGEKIGLVGHSGSGKTTITKLLLRFMDIDSGEILIDGQNIAKIKQDDLRRNISYVPQDPILFHRSLRENIAYGKSDATEAEMVAAAKAANAHDFITSLPQGYDTLVGERGIKLSGGERQRVAIARAMLKDAPILILDEATSALDSISERHIQEAFERLMKGRTTLAIAHRLSTIQKMDRIVVFDKGAIVEQGTHAELTKNDGVYAELWQEQSSGFIE